MTNTLVTIVMFALMIYMISRIVLLSKRDKKNKEMLSILDMFHDEAQFFRSADNYIDTQKDAEFRTKVEVLRLWGDAYYEKDDDFRNHLEKLDLNPLINVNGKSGIEQNEDSFFYLYLAIPNRLYYRKNDELRNLLHAKMDTYQDQLGSLLIKAFNEADEKFYENMDDRGRKFYQDLEDGNYGQYAYSKQLIGLYKQCADVFLAKLALEDKNQKAYDALIPDMKEFNKTRLGERWLKELGIVLPEEKTEEEKPAEADKEKK